MGIGSIGRWTLWAATVALAATACSGQEPSAVSRRDSGVTPTGGDEKVTLVVYAGAPQCPSNVCVEAGLERDLFVYDATADAVRRITFDGEEVLERLPRFRSVAEVSFVVTSQETESSVLRAVPSGGGAARDLLSVGDGALWAYDWTASGDEMAMMVVANQRATVRVHDFERDRTDTVATFAEWPGRGVADSDEWAVAWSPDERAILFVNTAHDAAEETIHVLDREGDVLLATRGTFGRWSAGGDEVYLLDGDALVSVSLAGGERTDLGNEEPALNPVLSPDGDRIAYFTPGPDPRVRVLRLADGEDVVLGEGVAPLWLSNRLLLATGVASCTDEDVEQSRCGGHSPQWLPTGTSLRLALGGGSSVRSAASTLAADVIVA